MWFQNARAKWRRNIMRHDSNPHASLISNGGTLTNGSLHPQPGHNGIMHAETMQPNMDDIHPHTPHPSHQITFSELY